MNIPAESIQYFIDFLFNVLFAFIGVVVALWYENQGSSRLEITSFPTSDSPRQDGRRARFLKLSVKNNPKRWWLVPRQTAYSCHGTVSFFTLNNKQVGKTIPIKWDGNPEPIRAEIVDGKLGYLMDSTLLRLIRYIDIPPDESEGLAFAVRIYGDPNAYGWTGESYQYNWLHPECELPPGNYIARIFMTTGDDTFRKEFVFRNPEKFEDFEFAH